MTELSDFWDVSRRHLADDYKDTDGQDKAYCLSIAEKLVDLLRSEGRDASIMYIVGGRNSEDESLDTLEPLPFGGRVSWIGHAVALSDGLVYDPILSEPIDLTDYPSEAFGVTLDVTMSLRPDHGGFVLPVK